MEYFDSHFHLPGILKKEASYTLPESIIGLEVGLSPNDIKDRIKLIRNKNVFLSIGAGPWELERPGFISVEKTIEALENDYLTYKADAIGEFGFDFHWNYGTREQQEKLFTSQFKLADKYDLPKIIHLRDADDEALKYIDYFDDRTIMHCFSSGPDILESLKRKGVYFSFSGNITYKGNEKTTEALRLVQKEKLLYETDSPYLAAGKMRGKTNTPELAELTLGFISEALGYDKLELKNICIENFYRVMGKKESVVARQASQ